MNKIAKIQDGKIIYGESSEVAKANPLSARHNRENMKVQHRKDMLQKNQVDYYKAYPEQAKSFNNETRRLLS